MSGLSWSIFLNKRNNPQADPYWYFLKCKYYHTLFASVHRIAVWVSLGTEVVKWSRSCICFEFLKFDSTHILPFDTIWNELLLKPEMCKTNCYRPALTAFSDLDSDSCVAAFCTAIKGGVPRPHLSSWHHRMKCVTVWDQNKIKIYYIASFLSIQH